MPSVKLKLVSDGGGVRTVLEKMIGNLLATDWIECSFVTSDSSTEKLFKKSVQSSDVEMSSVRWRKEIR